MVLLCSSMSFQITYTCAVKTGPGISGAFTFCAFSVISSGARFLSVSGAALAVPARCPGHVRVDHHQDEGNAINALADLVASKRKRGYS